LSSKAERSPFVGTVRFWASPLHVVGPVMEDPLCFPAAWAAIALFRLHAALSATLGLVHFSFPGVNAHLPSYAPQSGAACPEDVPGIDEIATLRHQGSPHQASGVSGKQ
jgi:hypothetical protein